MVTEQDTQLALKTRPDRIQRILLVAEDPSILSSLRLLLSHFGYSILEYSNGTTAISHIRQGLKVDVVLCDLNMPEASGEWVLNEVRKFYPTLPFILMTSFIGDEQCDRMTNQGLSGILIKPFKVEQVQEQLLRLEKDMVQNDQNEGNLHLFKAG